MSKNIYFVDMTLRDGHQSLWATRMTTAMMLPIAKAMDEVGYQRTAAEVRDAAHAADAKLVADGVEMGRAGTPVQVRNHDAAGVHTQEGPFMTASLPVAGFALIEAADLAEAIEIASKAPCAVCHGVVEVWPLEVAGDA